MPTWTRISPPAAGALSATWITRIGGVLMAVLLGGALLVQSCFSTTSPDPDSVLTDDTAVADARAAAQLGARVQDIEQRAALDAAAAARQLATQGAPLTGGTVTPAFDPTTGETLSSDTAPAIVPLTDDEAQLREVLRLEAIERRTRSLRSAPVAITYRRPPDAGLPTPAAATAAAPTADPPAEAGDQGRASTPLPPEPVTLMDTIQALQALDAQQTAGSEPAAAPAGLLRQALPGPSPLGPTNTAVSIAQGDPNNPALVRTPDDPPGWERLYEGSFVEAVLVNQLNGDFPGPVLAAVAVPVYSADRQRIVIPRGTRVVGSASATLGRDQARLAVGFHRLIFPDGRWVSLEFRGLNQIGESALRDQVNRHYFSMFASVGAVGIISGLTLRGSNPYAGGMDGFRAGAGQGLAQGATTILDRFLNRLPTITIRAGHRLRIWLTSDVLVPRPA